MIHAQIPVYFLLQQSQFHAVLLPRQSLLLHRRFHLRRTDGDVFQIHTRIEIAVMNDTTSDQLI